MGARRDDHRAPQAIEALPPLEASASSAIDNRLQRRDRLPNAVAQSLRLDVALAMDRRDDAAGRSSSRASAPSDRNDPPFPATTVALHHAHEVSTGAEL